jgi:hypothetical protein
VTYDAKLIEQAKNLITELDRLHARNPSTERDKEIQCVESALLKLTGAPTVAAAKVGINAYLRAVAQKKPKRRNLKKVKAALEAQAKPKKVKKPVMDPVVTLPPVTVVRGGLPGTGRK